MNRTIIERVPRIEGVLKVVQHGFGLDKSLFLESGRSRHLEQSLVGKYPLEAVQSTQMLSESAGMAHALASVSALENYLQLDPTPAALQIRQILLQLSTLRAHILHFYWELLPDYLNQDHISVSGNLSYFQRYDFHPNEKGEGDLSKEVGSTILEHIPEAARALDFIQQSIALLAGKFPVAMNLIPGGVTNFSVDRALLMKIIRNLQQTKPFIEETWPSDVKSFVQDLPETVVVPVKKVNLISFGSLSSGKKEDAERFYSNGVLIDNKLEPINELLITESLNHTFFLPPGRQNSQNQNNVDYSKEGARTWIRGARYDAEPMLTGALARMMVTHFGGSNLEISDLVGRMIDDLGLSESSPNCSASRLLAEVFEGRLFIKSTLEILLDFERNQPLNRQTAFDFSASGTGTGLVESPGGALLHQVFINDNRITQYRIVSSTNWNFSTSDTNGKRGIIESELNASLEKQVLSTRQISRIIHSYHAQIQDGTR